MAENVIVSVRWRPLVKREQTLNEEGRAYNWTWSENQVILNENDKVWGFDNVFDTKSTNKCVYDKVVQPIVKKALEGYNGTVFAYGQTGSGKTFTMRGYHGELGVIPLAVMEICDSISHCHEREFMMQMEYIEIYNEQIRDLLSTKETVSSKKPFVVENPDGTVVVDGINKPLVASKDQILGFLDQGDKSRSTAATNMNEHSSRSHALFRLRIESRLKDAPNDITISQLNLVDLAGSERAAQTGASGQTLKEGCHINKSLFMLGRVINELTTNSSHVSYRDSVLTRILSPALGGNARTAIICTLTQASGQETKSSLNFSASAKMIKNSVKINQVISKDTIISKQEKEIKRLRAECERMKANPTEAVENETKVDSGNEEEMRRRIEVLQKMIINSNLAPQEQPKMPARRMTWHPNQKPATVFKRQSNDAIQRPLSSMTIVNDENDFVPASDFLDKLDEEEEMAKIKQLNPGKKRTLSELSPNKRNIQVQKKMRSSAEGLSEEIQVSRVSMAQYDQLEKSYAEALEKIKTLESQKMEPVPEEPKNETDIAELKHENQDLRRKLAALEEVKQSTSFDATKLMQDLEAENILLKEKMATMEEEFAVKSAKLDEKLQLWGDAQSPDQFIGQIKSLHVQLQEKAKFVNTLEEKLDLKSNEIRLLNEQIKDLESQRSHSLNTSTIDEVANLKEHLRDLADSLQKEAREREILSSQNEDLKTQLNERKIKDQELPTPSKSPIKPGDSTQLTQAFAINEDILADLDKQIQANEKLQEQIKMLQEENTSLKEIPEVKSTEPESSEIAAKKEIEEMKEFFNLENEARKSVDAENESLRKENSLLKSQLENLSSLTDISSINEAHLKRTEADFHELECKISVLESNLSESNEKLKSAETSAKENQHFAQVNAELEYSLEMEKDKNKRRIEELTAELSVFRDTVRVKTTCENVSQTEKASTDATIQATVQVNSCGTTIDQDMPDSPEMIFLQEQVRDLNVQLSEARANAEGFTAPLQEKIESLNLQVVRSEELAAKVIGFESELAAAIADKNAKTEELQKLQADYVAIVAEKNELLSRIDTQEKQLFDVTDANAKTFNELQTEHTAVLASKNELASKLDALENELASSRADLTSKVEALNQLQSDHVLAVGDKVQLSTKVGELEKELEFAMADAKAKTELLSDAINNIKSRHEDSISDVNMKTEELKKLQSDHDFIHQELSSLTTAKEALESTYAEEKASFSAQVADLQEKIRMKDELIQNLNLEIMKIKEESTSSFKKPRLSDMGICDVIDVSGSSAVEISMKEEPTPALSRTEMSMLGIADADSNGPSRKNSIDFGHQAEPQEDDRDEKIRKLEESAREFQNERAIICDRISELEGEISASKGQVEHLQVELENSRALVTKLETEILATKKELNDASINTSFATETVEGGMNTSISEPEKVDGQMNTSVVEKSAMMDAAMNTSVQEPESAMVTETMTITSLPRPEVFSCSMNTSAIPDDSAEIDSLKSELKTLNEKLQSVTAERDELASKLNEISSAHQAMLQETQAKIEALQSDLSLTVSKLMEAEASGSQAATISNARVQELEAELKSKSSSLVDLDAQVADLKNEIEKQITASGEECKKYEATIQDFAQESTKLKDEMATIRDQLDQKANELLAVQSQSKAFENDLLLKEERINELMAKINDTSEDAKSSASKLDMLDVIRKELGEANKSCQELFEKNKELYEENKTLKEERAHQEEMLLQSAMQFKSFQEKIEELTSAREKDEPLKESLNKELEEKNAQLTEFKIQVSELNEERATLFKTIDELEAVKVKYEVLQESSTGNEKTKIENEHLRKRLEQACEFNEQEVEKRKTIENKLAATEASLAQSEKDSGVFEKQVEILQRKFGELDTQIFEKNEKIALLENEVKELQNAKRSLEEKQREVDPEEILRKDRQIKNLEDTLMAFKKEVESVRDEIEDKDLNFRKLKCEYEKIESEQDGLKRKLATKENIAQMLEQEFKKNQNLLSEKTDKVIELESVVRKFENDVERLNREVRLAKSSEASDEVVQRLRKDKDELKRTLVEMEKRKNQYKNMLETQKMTKSEEEWKLMREKLQKYYKLFNEEKKKAEELQKQVASLKSAAAPPRPPLSTQALIGGTTQNAPEAPKTQGKEEKKVAKMKLEDESPARNTRASRSRASSKKEEDENCKQQ